MKKHMLSLITLIVAAVAVGCTFSGTASSDTVNPTPTPVCWEEGDSATDAEELPMAYASFSIQFTSLAEKYVQGSDDEYDIVGDETLSYEVSWWPRSQYIKIGVRNLTTGIVYDTGDNVVTGGSYTGVLQMQNMNVPAGVYQVVVMNPYGAATSVSGHVNFWWDYLCEGYPKPTQAQ